MRDMAANNAEVAMAMAKTVAEVATKVDTVKEGTHRGSQTEAVLQPQMHSRGSQTDLAGRRPRRDTSQRDALLAAAKVDGPCPYEIDADGEVKVDTGTVDTGTTGLTRAKLTLAHRHTGKVDTGEVKVNRPGWAFVPGKDADPGTWHKRQGPVQVDSGGPGSPEAGVRRVRTPPPPTAPMPWIQHPPPPLPEHSEGGMDADIPYGTQVIHAMGTEIYVMPPPPEWKPISLFESSDEEWG